MEQIKGIAKKLIKDLTAKKPTCHEDVLQTNWDRLFSKKEQQHINKYYIRKDKIVLQVDSSAWIYLLNLKKEKILKELNRLFARQGKITKLSIRLYTD